MGLDTTSPSYTDGVAKQSDNDYSSGQIGVEQSDSLFRVNGTETSGGFTAKKVMGLKEFKLEKDYQ